MQMKLKTNLILLALLTGNIQGAAIVWDTPQNITGTLADFSTNGTFEQGIAHFDELGFGGSVDVSGVGSFDIHLDVVHSFPATIGSDMDTEGLLGVAYPAGNSEYLELLSTGTDWGANPDAGLGHVEIHDLTPGQEYEVQVWVMNANPSSLNVNTTTTITGAAGTGGSRRHRVDTRTAHRSGPIRSGLRPTRIARFARCRSLEPR